MHVRGFALALPLVLGIACTHTRSQKSADNATAKSGANQPSETATAPTPEPRTAQPNTAPGAEATAQGGQVDQNQTTSEPRTAHDNTAANSPSGASTGSPATASSGLPENNQTTSEPRLPQETTAPNSPDTTSSAMNQRNGSSSSMGSSSSTGASASSSDVTRDPIMERGDPAKAHADDTVVSGKIAKLTHRQLVIQTDAGERKSLSIVPQTEFQVDGKDAHRADLKEGQDVRASFSQVDGKDVAVKVRAGHGLGSSGSWGSGSSSGSSSYGPGSASGSGSTASPDTTGNAASPDDQSGNVHQGAGSTERGGQNGSFGSPSVPQTQEQTGSQKGPGR